MKHDNILPINAFYLTCLRDKRGENLTPIGLLIYIMLLSRADKEKLTCYPSIQTIAEDCKGLDRETVIKHLERLEELGIIIITKRLGKSSEFFMRDFSEWRKEPHY